MVNAGLLKTVTIRNTISVIEILLGVDLLGRAALEIARISECPTDAIDCEGWTMLGAVILIYPGFAFLLAGMLSIFMKRLSLLWIQVSLALFLFAFFALFVFF